MTCGGGQPGYAEREQPLLARERLSSLRLLLTLFVGILLTGPVGFAEEPMTLTLTSTAFADKGAIPRDYTCEGLDLSPPLAWAGVPPGTRSLALIIDDPDAPDPAKPLMTWVHWVLFNIPPELAALPSGAAKQLPAGIRQGLNDWKRSDYGGPCPPVGRHRYFHKLYALIRLDDMPSLVTKAALEKAMQGHILARAELVGTYRKGQ